MIFAKADTDGNGVLDVDEFVELCGQQPWLVSAFDSVLETGVRRSRAREESRLVTLFRHPVSPVSRVITEPGGQRRFRPSLHDLRPAQDIGDQLARASQR